MGVLALSGSADERTSKAVWGIGVTLLLGSVVSFVTLGFSSHVYATRASTASQRAKSLH